MRVIKHTISIEYECEETKSKHSIKLINNKFSIWQNHVEDWGHETFIEFKCPFCQKYHRLKWRNESTF